MNSELQKAIEQGDLRAVVAALERGADIEAADIHGDPGLPLRTACFRGHASVVVELLKRGANIDAPNADGSGAPVRMAARAQHIDIVQILLQHGAAQPPGVKLPLADAGERRHRAERRGGNSGPPCGLKDRRGAQERRVTSVQELELSDGQWSTYFASASEKAAHRHETPDIASLIFERVRD